MSVVEVNSGLAVDTRHEARVSVRRLSHPFWWRVAILCALFLGAFGVQFARIVSDSVAGSRMGYLAVAPFLVALSTSGYRTVPRGVGDNESDWIVAALTGLAGLTAITMITARFPTLAGLWRLDLVAALVWVVCAGMVVFSVRHVLRMWPAWLLAFVGALTVPYLLATAWLGGSDVAVVTVGAGFGAYAVWLAGRPARRRLRTAATMLCLVAGIVAAVLLTGPLGLLPSLAVSAVVVPVLATVGLNYLADVTGLNRWPSIGTRFNPLAARTLTTLGLIALALSATQFAAAQPSATPKASADWAALSGLGSPAEEFGFITRFLGPDSRFVRYEVPATGSGPSAAVDVISAQSLAALDDYSDVVWYPSRVPLNYRPADAAPDRPMPQGARVIHTNADTSTSPSAQNWYAITWTWRTPAEYQRVTVIVDQSVEQAGTPADPQPLSVKNTVIDPMLWIARQQPEASGKVDESVTDRAAAIVATLIAAGNTTP